MIAHTFAIAIPLDSATPAINRVIMGLKGSKNLARYGGRAVQKVVGAHVLEYAATHHATAQSLGAAPTGFFSDAYDLVTSLGAVSVEPNRAFLSLPRAHFARAFGDVDIKPGNGKKYLTFAACAVAYGRRAGSFANLTFGFATNPKTGKPQPALIEAGAEKKSGQPYFWLVRKSHQKQNSELLPSDNEMATAALGGAAEYIGTLIQKKGGSN
jgi:hypothetical protein